MGTRSTKNTKKNTKKVSVYDMVTNRMIEKMNQGIIPWHRPWFGMQNGAFNRVSGRPYSLLNQMLLENEGEYASFDQWGKLGGRIKKGSKSEFVVFWKMFPKEEKNEDGEIERKVIPMLRYYNVFHISQVEKVIRHEIDEPDVENKGFTHCKAKHTDENGEWDGSYEEYYEEHLPFEPKEKTELNKEINIIEEADKLFHDYIDREGIEFSPEEPSNQAYYSPSQDKIVLPLLEQFSKAEQFYSTAFHESVHSTGVEKRLNRQIKNKFGDSEYSKEELVAEIGAAMILNTLGIETEKTFNNSTAYVQNWLQVLKNDNKFIVSAAGQAEKAVKFIYYGKMDDKVDDVTTDEMVAS